MFYAVEHRYGRHVFNGEKRYYEFTRRALRDAWVSAGTDNFTAAGYREACDSRSAKRADFRIDGDAEGWRVLAGQRVDASPALQPYRYELVEYDWGNSDHWSFTATAPEREVMAWAKSTREGMYQDA